MLGQVIAQTQGNNGVNVNTNFNTGKVFSILLFAYWVIFHAFLPSVDQLLKKLFH